MPVLQQECPDIVVEMETIAAAADVAFADILVLNPRSEITLTHYADGCTSIAQVQVHVQPATLKQTATSFLTQN